jgi:hypothetical protein
MSPTSAPHSGARVTVLSLLIAIALAALALPGVASGADGVYWSDYLGGKLFHANLDGSGGGGNLGTASVLPERPTGIAIDAAAGRIYWADAGHDAIYWTSLDGSGAGRILTTGATVSGPYGLAIDPAAGRLYWANFEADAISYANLDGSGGGDLNTTGATLEAPRGLAIDPAANRVYWTDFSGNAISYAKLDGSGGGGDLDTTGATVSRPTGVALDGGRVYWANGEDPKGIFYADLGGGGGGQLNTSGAEVSSPEGIAIDRGTGRIFWADGGTPSSISYARLDGSGGGTRLNTAGATLESPYFLALLRAPQPAPTVQAPQISGQGLLERPLYCDQGAWASDLPGAFLYRAPQTYAYSWLRNGESIAGATESRYRPTKPGAYNCQVTAANQAGSTTQTSAELILERGYAHANGFAPVHGRRALVTLACTGDGRCKGLVKLVAHVGYKRVVFREGHRQVIRRRALFPIGKGSFSIFPGRTKVLHVKLKSKGARLLRHRPGRRWHVRLLGRDVAHRGLMLKMKR